MFIAASKVFAGIEPCVAAEKSCVHIEFEALLEAMHAFKTFAKVFSRLIGAVPVEGNVAPGALPVAMSTRLSAVAAASVMPLLLVADAPICAPDARNWDMAEAAATVVASFTTTAEPLFNEEHCPNTAAITAALFEAPTTPADPPRATRYKDELLNGHAVLFVMVKTPFESVVTGELKSAVGAEPLPAVPAA